MTNSSIYTRTTRSGETLSIGRPFELGIDSTSPWVTVCETHGTFVESTTRDLAYKSRGVDFCDDCRARGPVAKPAKQEPQVDFSKATQRRAWKAGHDAAFDLLVTILEERQDINSLIDAIEDNASADVRKRLVAYYTAKNALNEMGL